MVKVILSDQDIPTLHVILESLTVMRDEPYADDFDRLHYDVIINDVTKVLRQIEKAC